MTTLLTVLIILAAIALILIVLVQKSKGGGLSSSFSSTNAVMGVRKTTDFLEKGTWGLAGFIIVACILVVMITPRGTNNKGSQIYTQPNNGMLDNTQTPDVGTELNFPAPSDNNQPEQPAETPAE